MGIVNLPTDLLRTFVTVIEVQNYTRAADLLGRSQPAISLQIKRLEELVGYKLISHSGRTMKVSEKGEALAMHARQILRLNDLAVGLFDTQSDDETFRIGLPLDYGVRSLQRGLTDLQRQNAHLKITIQCDLSQNLLNALLRDEIDLAVAIYDGGDPQFLVRHWQELPFWAGSTTIRHDDFSELPLVAHPQGCVYLKRMTDALKLARRNWTVVFSSPDISAIQQAVLDNLGFSCLTNSTLQRGMKKIAPSEQLPELEPLRIGLFYRQTRLGSSGNQVVERMTRIIDEFFATPAVIGE